MRASSAPMRTRSRGRRPWLAVAVFALLAVVALAPARAAWEQAPTAGQQAHAQARGEGRENGGRPHGQALVGATAAASGQGLLGGLDYGADDEE